MAKVTITIEDTNKEPSITMDAIFEPVLEKDNLTEAQILACALFDHAREIADPETYKIRSVN
jgi:hypothetical protein